MQFWFEINLDDTEIEVLRRVIEHYLRVCRREIKQGGSVPFIAHSGVLIREIWERMSRELHQVIFGHPA